MYVTIIRNSKHDTPTKIGVNVPYSGTVRDLRRIISNSVQIAEERLILSLVYVDGDHCSLHNENMIDSIPEMDDCLFALEVPPDDDVKCLPGSKSISSTDASSIDALKTTATESTFVDGLAANYSKRMRSTSVTKEEKNTVVVVVTNVEVKDRRTQR